MRLDQQGVQMDGMNGNKIYFKIFKNFNLFKNKKNIIENYEFFALF